MPVPTPHIEAKAGQIAKTVLMPGDPLRSKFIAETFLENPVLVNNVRGVQGYTGTWKGVPVTVMASGMGIPSIGIYSWELYNFYDVDNIIRVGSAGALADDLKLMDVVAGAGACTDSNFAHQFGINGTFAPIADYTLLSQAVAAAAANGVALHVGNVLSSDNFYDDGSDGPDQWKKMGVRRDGGRRPVHERRPRRKARAWPVHDLRPHLPRRGAHLRAAAKLLRADDHDRARHRRQHGKSLTQRHLSAPGGRVTLLFIKTLYFRNKWDCL